jgi:hypothetical protein
LKDVAEQIEDGFETAKNEFGLDHNETRSHHGWYRHVSLVKLPYAMVTCAMVSSVRQRANAISASGECIPSSHQEQSLSAAFQQTDTTLSSLEAETVAAPSGDAISSASF